MSWFIILIFSCKELSVYGKLKVGERAGEVVYGSRDARRELKGFVVWVGLPGNVTDSFRERR